MKNKENKGTMRTCPGCPRHCFLSDPRCPRGSAYAEAGERWEQPHAFRRDDRMEAGSRHESRRGHPAWEHRFGPTDGDFRETGHHRGPTDEGFREAGHRRGPTGEGFCERKRYHVHFAHGGFPGQWGCCAAMAEGAGCSGKHECHSGPVADGEHAERGGRPHGGRHGGPHEWPDRSEAADDADGRLAFSLRAVGRMMRMHFDEREGQKRILVMLSEGPLTQRELTGRLHIQPGSASEIIFKLERSGLIERTHNPEDRRTMDIRLTDAGREEAARAEEERRGRRAEMFSCLTEEEKETLTGLLSKLREDWENRRAH